MHEIIQDKRVYEVYTYVATDRDSHTKQYSKKCLCMDRLTKQYFLDDVESSSSCLFRTFEEAEEALNAFRKTNINRYKGIIKDDRIYIGYIDYQSVDYVDCEEVHTSDITYTGRYVVCGKTNIGKDEEILYGAFNTFEKPYMSTDIINGIFDDSDEAIEFVSKYSEKMKDKFKLKGEIPLTVVPIKLDFPDYFYKQ